MIRQGDVLLIPTCEQPDADGYTEVPRDDGRIVLAHGEATGHAHAIYDDGVRLYQNKTNADDRILKVEGNVCYLRHEEHTKQALNPGNYRVVIQREYSPQEIRRVID